MQKSRLLRSVLVTTLFTTLLPLAPAHAAQTAPKSTFAVNGHPVRFQADVNDYVLYDCAGKKTVVDINAATPSDQVNGKKLKVDRKKKARFTKTLQADELVSIHLAARKKTYYIRCLPNDFPRLELEVKQAQETPRGFYLLPYYSRSLQGQAFSSRYYIITDHRGTPIWYRRTNGGNTVLSADGAGRLLTQGVLDGISPGAARPENTVKIVTLDGRTVADVVPPSSLVRPVSRTAQGNLVMISAPQRAQVDFTKLTTKFKDNSNGFCSLSRSDVTVQGLRITEVAPDGSVVWDQDLTDLIGFEEPSQASMVSIALPGGQPECVLDLFHQNFVSLAEDSSGYVVSLRWAGVYFVDRASRTISWKLGGSPTPQSLKIQSDPLGTSGPVAQHGGYLTADNRLLVFDNQLTKHILPRAVEYFIDKQSGTAAHLRSFSLDANFCVMMDGAISCPSNSQGGASYLPDGSVLVSWGNTDGRSHLATVFDADGSEIASLHSRSAKANVFTVQYAEPSAFRLADLRRHASSTGEIKNGTYR
jgi:hypothetical protein